MRNVARKRPSGRLSLHRLSRKSQDVPCLRTVSVPLRGYRAHKGNSLWRFGLGGLGLTGKRGTHISGIREASKRSGHDVFWHHLVRHFREFPLRLPKPTPLRQQSEARLHPPKLTILAFAGMQTTRRSPRQPPASRHVGWPSPRSGGGRAYPEYVEGCRRGPLHLAASQWGTGP